MNKDWYNKICAEVITSDCYRFKSWNPENDSPCIVDIGANVGAFTKMACTKFPNASIFSFEMMENNYNYAKSLLEEFKNVHLFNYAVVGSNKPIGMFEHNSNHGGHKPIFDDEANSYLNKSRFTAEWKEKEVPYISFDNLIKDNNIEKIDFLKLDCEGTEYEILFHIDKLNMWDKISHIAMEIHGRDSKEHDELIGILSKHYNVSKGIITICSKEAL